MSIKVRLNFSDYSEIISIKIWLVLIIEMLFFLKKNISIICKKKRKNSQIQFIFIAMEHAYKSMSSRSLTFSCHQNQSLAYQICTKYVYIN